MPDQSWNFWITGWLFEPTIILGLIALYGGYLILTRKGRNPKSSRPLSPGQFASFTSGMAVLAFALLSPLDRLGDEYWFTAHMTQHMLLTLIAPPLLLLGTPSWLFDPLRGHSQLLRTVRGLSNPYVGFLSFNVVFSLWHAPALYNAALTSEPVHVFEHLTFIGTALLTMMPVMSPTPFLPRLAPPVQVFYLFLQSLLPTGLGAVIAFDPTPLYFFYVQAPRLWGLSVMEDQLYAGLIMWVGGALFWLLALSIVFFKWFNREEPIEGQGFI